MQDILCLVLAISFVALSLGYVELCHRLNGGSDV